ncbi:MAG: enoyl-CoA hydratase/isomerase family protein [Syntrophobacterales bacterium]|nr:enoyl-CoA hydratase/isomerase family protein [Syntrophobacterales bacterium]
MAENVLEELRNGVYTITFNRPEKRNALTLEVLVSFSQALRNAQEKGAAVVVIRGAGRTFSAGGDIAQVKQSPGRIDSMADALHRAIMLIRKMDAIVIAVVEGLAAGAGVGLALACDLSVAEKKAIMNVGYRRLGLTPEGGNSFFLPRMVGAKKFNELYLFSRNINMDEALDLGLVNYVWDETELEANLDAMVKELMALPLETIPRFKNLVNHSVYGGLELHLDRERFSVSQLGGSDQFKERLNEIAMRRREGI